MRRRSIAGCLLAALLVLSLGAACARAERKLLTGYFESTTPSASEKVLKTDPFSEPRKPPPVGEIEDACGLAIGSNKLYVSDFHHGLVDVFDIDSGSFQEWIAVPADNRGEGPCGLALDAAKNLYVNLFHESALRLLPPPPPLTPSPFDVGEGQNRTTGVAVDGAVAGESDVYVNDRTYVAVYKPSALGAEDEALRIGVGSLGDAYGLAVFDGRVYVPDAADDTVKVFEPAVSRSVPVATIAGPAPKTKFTSLLDAAVAVDPTNEHLLVVDNRQPGFEEPVAAIYEFDSSGKPLGRLPSCTDPVKHACREGSGPIDGEPSGLAVDPDTGKLFVTTGNGENANLFEYGPYQLAPPASPSPLAGAEATTDPGASALTAPGQAERAGAGRGPAASASEVVRQHGVQVNFDGKLTPHALPRHGAAPVGISIETRIAAVGGGVPPQLRKIAIAINRNGRLSAKGLPVCRLPQIQPSTTAGARAACGRSLVGEGHFSANVKLPEQSPFPSSGKVLAFNGRLDGKPAILAHIYGAQPAPTSTVLPFLIRGAHGAYGTTLEASLPEATGEWGYVTGLKMNLRRRFSYRGKARSYLTAGCPAPAGFPGASFPLARTSFDFAGEKPLVSVLSRTCRAIG